MFSPVLESRGFAWCGNKASADGWCTYGVIKRHSLASTPTFHPGLVHETKRHERALWW